MESNLKIFYFDVPGRVELSRLMLNYAGIKFTDERISFQEYYAKLKPDKTNIIWTKGFGQLPILEHNGFFLAQSQAIH
jgi:hypothetical protein